MVTGKNGFRRRRNKCITWLEKVGYKDIHGLEIIKAKTGEQLTRLEDATDEQLSIVVTYCINLDTKRKKGESQ